MSENKAILPDDAAERISAALIKWLTERFEDEELWQDILPLINVLVLVGIAQGIGEAERLLEGVASDNPYASWRAVIENATAGERIVLMEVARQQGIADRVRELKAQKEWNDALKMTLQVAISILIALI